MNEPKDCDHEFDAPDLPCAYCGKTAGQLGITSEPEAAQNSEAKGQFAPSTLLEAVGLACDKWEWIQAGTREPLSIALKRPENEMHLFEMVISMNNLRTKMQKFKASNAEAQ